MGVCGCQTVSAVEQRGGRLRGSAGPGGARGEEGRRGIKVFRVLPGLVALAMINTSRISLLDQRSRLL